MSGSGDILRSGEINKLTTSLRHLWIDKENKGNRKGLRDS
jgi:hypothetical protein